MPIHKVKGGFKWGSKGKVYKSRKGAERQAAAAYARGYKESAATIGSLVSELRGTLAEAQTAPFTGRSLGRKMSDAELARAIRLDLEAEMDAINLYTAHLEATDNKQAIEILKHVIKEERDHATLFIELIKTLDPQQKKTLDQGKEYFDKTVKSK